MVSKVSLGNQPLQAFARASLSHWPELGPVTNGGGKLQEGGGGGEGRGGEYVMHTHLPMHINLFSLPKVYTLTYSNNLHMYIIHVC